MGRFAVEFTTDNAAFYDDADDFMPSAVAAVLRGLADRIDADGEVGVRPVFDVNGNRIGAFAFDPEDGTE